MTVIDGVFCVGRACDKQTRDIPIVTVDGVGLCARRYNTTADSVVRDSRTRDRRTKLVTHEFRDNYLRNFSLQY